MRKHELIAASKKQYGVALNLINQFVQGGCLSFKLAEAVQIFNICSYWKKHFEEESKKDKTLHNVYRLFSELYTQVATRFVIKEEIYLDYGRTLTDGISEETKNFKMVAAAMKNNPVASAEWREFVNNSLFAK